jgi:type II secretory pathway component PulM
MNFDDIKEQILGQLRNIWERISESSAYNQLKDRFENLSPRAQKASLIGAAILLVAITLSFPLMNYSESNSYVSEFEEKRATIRELLKVTREAADVPDLAQPPAMDQLKTLADTQMKNANLLPEQVRSIEVGAASSKLIPPNLTSGSLTVNLAKLNLRQVIDLGYQLQAMNTSVKMQDLIITATREDAHYFDVVYKLIALAVPSALSAPEPESIAPKGGRKMPTPPTEDGP